MIRTFGIIYIGVLTYFRIRLATQLKYLPILEPETFKMLWKNKSGKNNISELFKHF